MQVTVNADHTVAIEGATVSGALDAQVNRLDLYEVYAVLFAARMNPYPASGTGDRYFIQSVRHVRAHAQHLGKVNLGAMRRALVLQAYGSNGAALDTWIAIAYHIKTK